MAEARDAENRKRAIAYMQEFKRKRAHIYKNKKQLAQQSSIVGALKQSSPDLLDRRSSILVTLKDFQESPQFKKMTTISESPEQRLKQVKKEKVTEEDLKTENSCSLKSSVFSSSSSSLSSESTYSNRKKQPLDKSKITPDGGINLEKQVKSFLANSENRRSSIKSPNFKIQVKNVIIP